MIYPYHECPNFKRCSAPLCLLDPDIALRTFLPGTDKCKAEKPTRVRIAGKYPELLPYQGLTRKKFNSKKKWNELSSPEKRDIILQRLKKARKTLKKGIVEPVANP